MLRQVLAVDLKQRRISALRVRLVHAGVLVGGRLRQASAPGRDGAGGIARTLAAQGRQVLAQARGLSTVNTGLCLQRARRQQQDG